MPIQRNRFRIIDFLIWCLCTFAIFSITTSLQANNDVVRHFSGINRLFTAITGVLYGGVAAGSFVLFDQCLRRSLRRKTTGTIFFPGHWLVFYLVLPLLVEVAVFTGAAILRVPVAIFLEDSNAVVSVFNVISRLGQVAICAVAIKNRAQEYYHWEKFFGSLLLFSLATWLYNSLGYPETSTNYLVALIPDILSLPCIGIILSGLFLDARNSQSRDWIHWLGVGVYLFLNLWGLFWNTIGWRLLS